MGYESNCAQYVDSKENSGSSWVQSFSLTFWISDTTFKEATEVTTADVGQSGESGVPPQRHQPPFLHRPQLTNQRLHHRYTLPCL